MPSLEKLSKEQSTLAALRRLARTHRIAGVDEAGRGCLAGPVVAAAVVLPGGARLPGVADSKTLGPEERERLCGLIERRALAFAVKRVEPKEIDARNILQATYEAMRLALAELEPAPHYAAVDGYPIRDLSLPQLALVRGDALFLPISAASILAKVYRDRMMAELDGLFPGYGFARHKGYGTREHLEALGRLGPSPIHRLTYRPVAALLEARLPTYPEAHASPPLLLCEVASLRSTSRPSIRAQGGLPSAVGLLRPPPADSGQVRAGRTGKDERD